MTSYSRRGTNLSVAVYTREGAYARGFGVTDVETGERADADTAFYIASSTKPLTALALSSLHQRRVLDLDMSLAAYAPNAGFPAAVRPGEVKLNHMLSHTSGIANEPIGYRVAFSGQHDPQTLWRLLATSVPNENAPLGHFEYTNTGYNITTILTDRRLGVRWQDLLQREIFGPSGMTRASAFMSRARIGGWRVAKPHALGASGKPERIYLEKTDQTMQSAGGVIMSANGAARWLELMIEDGRIAGRQVVASEAVEATRMPLADEDAEFEGYKREHYGLGWHMGPYRGDRMFHHFGDFAGFRAHVSYIPARGIGVAAFINEDIAASSLVDAIANYVYDRTGDYADAAERYASALAAVAERRAKIIPAVAADRAKRAARAWTLSHPRAAYAGTYENDQWGRVDVVAEGDVLEVRFGVMHAVAEPFTRPDSIRVELVPHQGEVIDFVFEGGASPAALKFQGARFSRR